ncbi:SatD family protein [Metabacillus litoralis]|uniref:SatD family protein n=1 Tax=Metabacillus litoralis TaxID=152268 RepID=UPI001CFD6D86|nr:SatD family protein [Metabacillus litoralis]
MDRLRATCITADVINSRKNKKEEQLELIAKELNEKFSNSLLTEFTVRAGDELFGVVNNFNDGYWAFKELFYLSKKFQVPLYVGGGFGEVGNEKLDNPDGVNGRAIWNAADALKILKDKKFKTRALQSLDENFKFMFIVGDNRINDTAINYLLYFILEKIKKRTELQSKAIELIEKNSDLTYEDIGEKLGYERDNSKSNVSKLLSRAEHTIVKEGEQELINLINTIYNFREGLQ